MVEILFSSTLWWNIPPFSFTVWKRGEGEEEKGWRGGEGREGDLLHRFRA